jgi:hypothetical protein
VSSPSLVPFSLWQFTPAGALGAYEPAIGASAPPGAMAGLRCLGRLQSQLAERSELPQFGLGEAARYPEMLDDLQQIPAAARPYAPFTAPFVLGGHAARHTPDRGCRLQEAAGPTWLTKITGTRGGQARPRHPAL